MPLYAGEVNAPDFSPGADWLNTGRSLSIRDLRGKVVLLDFWTYCCINCMHILPDLKRLERKYASELVVVGVHSAKFTAERETENIRQAVLRYEIEHPVVNDPTMRMWRQYGVRAWPTVVLIDPQGKVIGGHSGEGIYEPFDAIIGKVIESFDGEGLIDRQPLSLVKEADKTPEPLLSFPGKVLADPAGGRLFIADSNHNRVIVASLAGGSVMEVIGCGDIGIADGDFASASFHHPNGMALDGSSLYIADTENHAIRRADLAARRVETVAGTGRQSRTPDSSFAPGHVSALNSPWDLAIHGRQIYIAMAGSHQIWRLDLDTWEIGGHAGTGQETLLDGSLDEAALAQPSGITTDGRKVYFADSEVSAIRSADIDPHGRVSTIVGTGLFDYGDVDGAGDNVRLQHPLGVAWADNALYVVDTYNNKIKCIFPQTRAAATFAGTGVPGLRDGAGDEAGFDEPAGISAARGKLYVADTNNHAIRVVDLETRRVSTFELREIQRLARWTLPPVRLDPQPVRTGSAEVELTLELSGGYRWNPDAPVQVFLSIDGGEDAHSTHAPGSAIRLPIQVPEGEPILRIEIAAYYCGVGREAVCLLHEENLEIPLRAGASGDPVVALTRRIG